MKGNTNGSRANANTNNNLHEFDANYGRYLEGIFGRK